MVMFEEFGAITLRDIQPMVDELLAYNLLRKDEFQQYYSYTSALFGYEYKDSQLQQIKHKLDL